MKEEGGGGPPSKSDDAAKQAALLEAGRLQSAKERELTMLLAAGDKRGLTLMKQISQETFDEAVKENMDEFGLSREEAIKDALEQFESQGVNTDGLKKK